MYETTVSRQTGSARRCSMPYGLACAECPAVLTFLPMPPVPRMAPHEPKTMEGEASPMKVIKHGFCHPNASGMGSSGRILSSPGMRSMPSQRPELSTIGRICEVLLWQSVLHRYKLKPDVFPLPTQCLPHGEQDKHRVRGERPNRIGVLRGVQFGAD